MTYITFSGLFLNRVYKEKEMIKKFFSIIIKLKYENDYKSYL